MKFFMHQTFSKQDFLGLSKINQTPDYPTFSKNTKDVLGLPYSLIPDFASPYKSATPAHRLYYKDLFIEKQRDGSFLSQINYVSIQNGYNFYR